MEIYPSLGFWFVTFSLFFMIFFFFSSTKRASFAFISKQIA